MSTFLLGKHNLADLSDVERARENLGLGRMALLDENDLLNHDVLKTDELWLLSNYGVNKVLTSDHQGKAYWDYISRDNYESNLSQFHNDVGYVVQNETLNPASNLSDVYDKVEALSNLGMHEFIAPLDENGFRFFDKLKLNDLILNNLTENEALIVKNDGNIKSTPILTDANTVLSENMYSAEVNPETKLTSLSFMHDMYSSIHGEIQTNLEQISELQAELETIQDPSGNGSKFLRTTNNLNDLNDRTEALCNLGLQFINPTEQSIKVTKAEVEQFIYPPPLYDDHQFLTVKDNEGRTEWSSLPLVNVNLGTAGTVIMNNNTESEEFFTDQYIFSKLHTHNNFEGLKSSNITLVNRVSELEDSVNTRFTSVQIPTNNISFQNGCNYMVATNNLSDLTNVHEAYSNLRLELVSHTGDFNDLMNIPEYLRDDVMEDKFLLKDNNLSDFLGNYELVRSNLGLGDMALQDANDIDVNGGVIRDLTSLRTQEFILDSNVPNFSSLSNILFLKAIDVNGTAGWGELPSADYQNPGLVFAINDEEQRDIFFTNPDEDFTSVYSASYIDSKFQGMEALVYEQASETENLTVLSNLIYRPDEERYAVNEDGEQFQKVLVLGENNVSEWISMSNALSSYKKHVEVNTVDLHQVTTVNTQSLDVYHTIQYDDGGRTHAVDIPEGCILYSDSNAVMHWRNSVRIGDIGSISENGLTFEQRTKEPGNDRNIEYKMHFYQEDGKMIIAQEGIEIVNELSVGNNEFTIKHIFR